MQVNILEAKNRISELIKSVLAGEDVVIANRGEPVVRLVRASIQVARSPAPCTGHAISAWLDQHPLPVHHRSEHLEAGIEEERGGWSGPLALADGPQ